MKRKLYLVDYEEENGQDKHRVIEGVMIGCATDSEIVQMIHFYVGKNSRLSSVLEFTTDMALSEFDAICDTPGAFAIPHRILYVDMDEVRRVRECMSK